MSRTKKEIESMIIDSLREMDVTIGESFDKDDNFADYGITSAQAIVLIEKLKEYTGRQIDVDSLWRYSSVSEFISAISSDGVTSKHNYEAEGGNQKVAWEYRQEREEYAIVGIGCRFPEADNAEEFWENLVNKRNSITTRRYGESSVYGGFIKNVDNFDNRFFRVSPIEAEKMDPQQRHLLEVTWEAFEDAQISPEDYNGKEVGVFVGISGSDYGNEIFANTDNSDIYGVTGNSHAIASNRISYFYNFIGPSMSIDTACSSSLVAVHYACLSLKCGDCELAVVAGANTILNNQVTNVFENAGMLSPDHQCKTFDDSANGYVRGEGIGVILIKEKQKAIEDGNYIYATILGSAINQDGKSNGLTAPNLNSQVKVINKAMKNAKVSADDITYVEAHGTGTNLGDPIEVSALGEAICEKKSTTLKIGSVKTNIGHLEAAAGIASLIKVSLCLNHKKLVPSLNYAQLNKKISLADGKIAVQTSLEPWKSNGRRTAGISSFGFGGTNAHAVLAEFDSEKLVSLEQNEDMSNVGVVMPVSAKCPESLKKNEEKAVQFVGAHADCARNIARAYATGRSHFEQRAAFLLDANDGEVAKIHARKGYTVAKTAFIFSGQGPGKMDWSNELDTNIYFNEKLSEIDHLFSELSGWSIKDVIAGNSEKDFENTDVAQPVIFAIQVSLAYMLGKYGIIADGVVGHSLGEIAAAAVSEKLSLKDAVYVIYIRSTLMQKLKGKGRMLSIELPKEQVSELIAEYKEDVRIAVVNAKSSCVISGTKNILETIQKELDKKEIRNIMLGVLYPFHGAEAEKLQEEMEKLLRKIRVRSGSIHAYSTVTASKANPRTYGAKYWSNQVYNPVLFEETVGKMVEDGFDYFVEINMQSLLCSYVSKEYETVEAISVLNKRMTQKDSLGTFIGKSYLYKLPVDWSTYYGDNIERISIPKYAWNDKRYWYTASKKKADAGGILFEAADSDSKEADNREAAEQSYIKNTIADALHIDVSDLDDNDMLVELGIDSIMAYSIRNKIETQYQCSIPLTFLINDMTIKDVETFVKENTFKAKDSEEEIDVKEDVSDMQSLLWTMYQANPENCAYNQVFTANLFGDLDVASLKEVLQQLLIDHSELRACFYECNGEICKKIRDITEMDFFYYKEDQIYTTEAIVARIEEIQNTPFVLETESLFKIYLFRTEEHYVISVCAHHTVIDLASIEAVLKQLVENYQLKRSTGEIRTFAEKSYDKFIYEHKHYIASEEGEADKGYWSEKLQGSLPIVDLSTKDRPKTVTYAGDTYRTEINESISKKIKQIAKKANVTPSAFLMAVYYVLLYKYTGEKDIIVGMSASLRNEFKCHSTVGDFVNLLPVRMMINSKQSVMDFVTSVKKEVLDAISHQRYPFKKMLEDTATIGTKGFSPIVQVAFSQEVLEINQQENVAGFVTGHNTSFEFAGISLVPIASAVKYSPYDLLLMADTSGLHINLAWQYNTDIMDAEFVANMASHFKNILIAIANFPEVEIKDIHMLNDNEYARLFQVFNDIPDTYDDRLLIDAFEKAVEKYPQNIAISKDGIKYTYQEFNQNINKIGRYLMDQGLRHGDCVAICLNKSIETMELMFATLKIGCVYVPIDPDYPENRIQFILNATKAKVVFTENSLANILDETSNVIVLGVADVVAYMDRYAETNIDCHIDKKDLAYIIFTSGTTGTPKGVMIEHIGICNMVQGLNKGWGVQSDSKVLQFASLSFDASIAEIFITLLSGAELVLKDKEEILPGSGLEKVLMEEKITDVILTPSVLMLTDANGLNELRTVLSAGESCNSTVIQKWAQGRRFVNAYGPTESTVCATYKLCTPEDFNNITIGMPIEGTKIYVLDDDSNPVPIGMKGELCITSIGLARGYMNMPEQTADKFIENTIDENGFERIYRTSDVVRYSQNGEIRFCGRKDNQVKIRGFRIELDEVENVLNKCAGVKEGTVILKEMTGDKRLIAFVCPKDETVTELVLRKAMKDSLPQYMIPSHFEFVDSLPHSISGKVDKKIVSTYEIAMKTAKIDDSNYSEIQKTVRNIWCEVLGYEGITLEDDFYEAGGHSLLASQVKTKIEKKFDISIDMSEIMEYSQLKDFCVLVESKQHTSRRHNAVLEPKYETNYIPVTYAQNRLLFLYQLNKTSTEYNIAGDLILSGELNEEAFQEAYKNVIWKNQSLRTIFFKENDKYYQKIVEDIENYALEILYESNADTISQYIEETKHFQFNLFQGPLIKSRLIRTTEKEYILSFSVHHIISDGWSISLLVDEWSEEYNRILAGKERTKVSNLQFSDYAIWSAENIQGKKLDELDKYWKNRLGDSQNDVISIVSDYKRPAKMTNRGKVFYMKLNEDLSEKLHEVCAKEHATLFMVLLSSFNILQSKLTGKKRFNVGIPVAGRNMEDTQRMMGMFINTIVNHTDITLEQSYAEYLQNVRREVVEDIEHQEMPFERLVEITNPERNMSYSPLFQILFNMLSIKHPNFSLVNVKSAEREQYNREAKYDITIYASDDKRISIEFLYNADIYKEAHMQLIAEQYVMILEQIAADVNMRICDISLNKEEVKETEQNVTQYSLREMVKNSFAIYRSNVALRTGMGEILYAELEKEVLRYARTIAQYEDGEVLYLYANRNERLMYGVLGCIYVGKTFAIVDSRYPINRVQKMLDAVSNSMIWDITEKADLVNALSDEWKKKVFNPSIVDADDHTVGNYEEKDSYYVVFTSGTTGIPKAVKSKTSALAHFVNWYQKMFGVNEKDVFSVLSGLSHDPILRDILVPICSGASMCIPTEDVLVVPYRINKWMNINQVTVIHQTPSLVKMFTEEEIPSVRLIGFGGEKLTHSTLDKARKILPNAKIMNFYGTSETPQVMAYMEVLETEENDIPVGKGIDDVEVVIVDDKKHHLGNMSVGQVAIRTDYLSEGYVSVDTEQGAFSECAGKRIYYTGDVGYKNLEGNIVLLSRNDEQMKNRGFRIEPTEIESTMLKCCEIKDAKVMMVEDNLMAFVVEGKDDAVSSVKQTLLKELPLYMIPNEYVKVEAIPLTVNGKADANKLKEIALTKGKENLITLESGGTLDIVSSVWKSLLKRDEIGINDNFFDIGGYSFLLLELYERLSAVIEQKFEIVDLFQYPTIQSFADYIDNIELKNDKALSKSRKADTNQKKEALRNRRMRRDRSTS